MTNIIKKAVFGKASKQNILKGLLSVGLFAVFSANAQLDALNEDAIESKQVQYSMLMGLSQTENKMIAVGERGHIIIKNNDELQWTQAKVPVRVTLTSSFFMDDNLGWAVGHDGVVLRTTDGGKTWLKLLDGLQVNELMSAHADKLIAQAEEELAVADDEAAEQLTEKLENLEFFKFDSLDFIDEGASRPFLDVWFKNSREGYVVGAFGLILHTVDAGDTWTPWVEHIDNTDGFHLNAIEKIGDNLFIAAEAGTIFRSSDDGITWQTLYSPYDGSFFGISGIENTIVAYGLRGNAYISNDDGDDWDKIETGVDSSLFGATVVDKNHFVIVGASGLILHVDNKGDVIKTERSPIKVPLSSVVSTDNQATLTVSGLAGIQAVPQQAKGE